MSTLNQDICFRALVTRDARFDGRFFVGISTTKIYCRPICPAGPSKQKHCHFFVSAAAAQAGGYRPCLRCRPESAPHTASWRGTANTVSRAMKYIAGGELNAAGSSVERLAEKLGVSDRQLRRLFLQHVGASPVAVAQTQRVNLAKQLIHDTELTMANVAIAAGFSSIRRFNEVFKKLFGRGPNTLRKKSSRATTNGPTIELQLPYRAPYDWESMLQFFRMRAIENIEFADAVSYRRKIRCGSSVASIEVSHSLQNNALIAKVEVLDTSVLSAVVLKIRQAFDLDIDILAVDEQLSKDLWLAPHIAARPGLRVPSSWDDFELCVRAILGQQVTIESARRLLGEFVRACGSDKEGLFPTPQQALKSSLNSLKMPNARRETLKRMAQAFVDDPEFISRNVTLEETISKLQSIQGIGPWSAHYIALRGAREPDAFPAGDVALLRTVARLTNQPRLSQLKLTQLAQQWSPWRGYAAQHLWALDVSAQERKK